MKSIKFVLITAVLDVALQKFFAVTYYSLIPVIKIITRSTFCNE